MPGVIRHDGLGCWVVTDPATVRASFMHDGLVSRSLARCLDLFMSDAARRQHQLVEQVLTRWLVQLDGPAHEHLRRTLVTALSPARIRAMRPEVTEFVDSALDDLAAADEPDAVAMVADVIPARVMCSLLGLGDVELSVLYRWTQAIAAFLDGVYRRDAARQAHAALLEMCAELAGAESSGFWAQFADNPDERLPTGSVLLFGGLETTASLIGTSLRHVVDHPDTGDAIREGGTRAAATVVEEVLSRHPPLSHVARVADRDIELGGECVPAGGLVLLSLTGHDVIAAPERVARPEAANLAFGHGHHYCVGAVLSRLEAVVAVTRFCERFPKARSVDPPAWRDNSTYTRLRGLRLDLGG
jgi:cytochrome P450